MALTFRFYKDSALTQPVASLTPIATVQKNDGSSGPEQIQIFLGSTTASKKLVTDTNPGVDQIVVSVSDADALTGEPTTAVKLATTQVGLATATPGDPLNVGVEVLSGEVNAFSFWIELEDATGVVGTYTDLKLVTNLVNEVVV